MRNGKTCIRKALLVTSGRGMARGACGQDFTARPSEPLLDNSSGQGGMANTFVLGNASQSLPIFF